ncbi:wsv366 [White spot syndrome virus]|uniref:Wsv366 n=1 Tax=White spot syndrome virus TaxID=342409 RepID=K7WHT8_9VIRU|nr:wsv366 [White spot syndrome virus]
MRKMTSMKKNKKGGDVAHQRWGRSLEIFMRVMMTTMTTLMTNLMANVQCQKLLQPEELAVFNMVQVSYLILIFLTVRLKHAPS